MKYLKTYEVKVVNTEVQKALDSFYSDYQRHKTMSNGNYYKAACYMAGLYNVPEIFYDEFAILEFYYEDRSYNRGYSTHTKKVDEVIKKLIKKEALDSILKKFDNIENYFDLKKCLEKRHLNTIGQASVKYIFFLFHSAIRKAPEWIKDSNDKYNL